MESLSRGQARRVALAAQGFLDPPHAQPTLRTLERTVRRTGVLQIDSVNVLARAHFMPLYARMGPYDTDLLRRASAERPRRLVEYWAHEAAYMPVDLWPLMQHRMAAAHERAWGGPKSVARENPQLLRDVLADVRGRGARSARQIEADLTGGTDRATAHWGWNWSEVKKALEFLFYAGEITVAGRNSSFERLYDVPERVLPASVLAAPTPAPAEAHRELVRRAAVSHGVASEQCLRDYYRMGAAETRAAVADLVEAGDLLPVTGRGVAPAGVPPSRGAAPAPGAGPHPAQPLRPGGLGASAHRGALRLPLPDRDLRAGAATGARLLRAALPAGR
jgi:uncharacterized protein YcaQ